MSAIMSQNGRKMAKIMHTGRTFLTGYEDGAVIIGTCRAARKLY